MKLLIAGTLAAGLLLVAGAPFAQTPPVHSNANKGEEKAEYKEQWKDCMARMEANSKNHEKPEGQHKGEGKAAGAGKVSTTSKPTATSEPQGEAKKMNRHEEQMQACREQLYGGKQGGEGKEAKVSNETHEADIPH